jgi:hypothetical protein
LAGVTLMRTSPVSRRRFIQLTTRGAAGLAVLPTAVRAGRAAETGSRNIVIADPEGVLGRGQAPVTARLLLPDSLRRATVEGRLVLRETGSLGPSEVSAQVMEAPGGEPIRLCWLMPPGAAGNRSFKPMEVRKPTIPPMNAGRQPNGSQFLIADQGRPVLQYNYAKIDAGDVWPSISADNRKYAVARSDYIHPLYGPEGEVLTKDWSPEHPHHRGIYWAWPEVDWHRQRGDLHALQRVFARPSGKCQAVSGPVFAQVDAENTWQWETGEPIVRERAIIRVYLANSHGRLIDCEFHFEALVDPVQLARRGTIHYGGLNLRLNAVKDQQIIKHTDPVGPAQARQNAVSANPRAAWSDLSGLFPGATHPAGLAVFQHASNPDYPGEWIDYPELNWVQPTFPAGGTRYELQKGNPLTLRFRLWIHSGPAVTDPAALNQWRALHAPCSSLA